MTTIHNPPGGQNFALGQVPQPAQVGAVQRTAPTAAAAVDIVIADLGASTEAYFASGDLADIPWDAVAQSLSSLDTSVSIGAIMEMLIRVLSEMRKANREAALAEAQNSVEMGIQAAAKMIESADKTLAAAQLTAGMQMGMAAIELGMAAKAFKDAGTNIKDFNADAGDRNRLNQLRSSGENAPGADGDALPDLEATAAQPHRQVEMENLKAKLDANSESRNLQSQRTQSAVNMSSAVGNMGNAIGKLASSSLEHEAAVGQALAQALKTVSEYEQARAQQDYDFANQTRDMAANAQQTKEKVEEARHKASEAIYGM